MTTPDRFGRYTIDRVIGRGAMGVVYLAEDPVIGRKLAVKVIHYHGDLDDQGRADSRARFQSEFRLAGTLKHPNIVTVFDVGQEEDGGFIAMELVEGPSLSRRMSSGDLSRSDVLRVAMEIGSALDYAHARGIVHRDIKPANILIDGDGRAKLADFGIAKLAENDLTATGTLMGTPWYLPPESLTGEGVTAASDQYSLATILYEILVGSRPFEAKATSTVLYKIVHECPEDPCHSNPDLPEGVSRALLTALEKRPEKRFSSCTEFAKALAEAYEEAESTDGVPKPTRDSSSSADLGSDTPLTGSGTKVKAVSEDAFETASHWILEHRWTLGLGVLILSILAGVGAMTLGGARDQPEVSLPVAQEDREPSTIELTLVVESDPPGAEIWVDGASVGQATPSTVSLSGLRGETLALELRRENRVLARKEFRLGETTEEVWTATLISQDVGVVQSGKPVEPGKVKLERNIPPVGRIRIETRPSGAFLMIDDRPIPGRTPLEIDVPGEGTTLWLHAAGYASRSWTFDARAMSEMEIRERILLLSLPPAPIPGRLEKKTSTVRAGGPVEIPALIFQVSPELSSPNDEQRTDGVVILGLVLDTDGYVGSIEVLRGLDPKLDRIAVEAIKLRRYSRSYVKNRPVQVELTVTVRFDGG